jgi:hypothetical protein
MRFLELFFTHIFPLKYEVQMVLTKLESAGKFWCHWKST